jgi:hypothetical protein
MTKLHSSILLCMQHNLEKLLWHRVALIPFRMTHEQALYLTATPKDAQILLQASDIASRDRHRVLTVRCPLEIDGASEILLMLSLRTHGDQNPPFTPRHPEWQPRAVCEVANEAIGWLQQRLELGRKFATARFVLGHVFNNCDNGAQLRYILPATLHLAERDKTALGSSVFDEKAWDRLDRWRQDNSVFRAVGTPAFSPDMKRLIREVGGLITSSVLVADVKAESYEQVVPSCGAQHMYFECLPGVKLPRM